MYKDNLAIGIKVRGRVLREKKDTVFLPFGTEYSVFIKNLNTVRAQCRITVDGTDIGYGTSFVVQPNSTLEIERYVKKNNEGNRFKFIERTEAIENHRGIKLDDGLIRVEYQFEKVYPQYTGYYYPIWYTPGPSDTTWYGSAGNIVGHSGCFGGDVSLTNSSGGSVSANMVNTTGSNSGGTQTSAFHNDAGITVPGSLSTQQFTTISGFALEGTKHLLVLKLTGQMEGKKVQKVVTVRQKQECQSCGKVNKFTSSFCSRCGTSLKVI